MPFHDVSLVLAHLAEERVGKELRLAQAREDAQARASANALRSR